MHRSVLIKSIGLLVAGCGLAVICGWVFDIALLKSILPGWVTMKFLTAVSFFWCGIALYIGALRPLGEEGRFDIALVSIGMIVLVTMSTLLFSWAFGLPLGIEQLFVREAAFAVKSVAPGMPSVATIIAFLFLALSFFASSFSFCQRSRVLRVLGFFVAWLGLYALVGYAADVPLMYFALRGVSTAMAVHTAFLFLLMGAGVSIFPVFKRKEIIRMLINPRVFLAGILILIASVLFGRSDAAKRFAYPARSVIKVGILHSLTGPMAVSERPVVAAELLAIDEVNASGGINGARVEAVVADGASDPVVFAREAQRLITEENVVVLVGCWTSASRKAVRPIVEKEERLLLYPVQFEGMERSSHIIYLGQTANQQLIPTVSWVCANLGRKVFLIGSDYVYPRLANEIAKDSLAIKGATVVGEEYLPLDAKDFSDVVQKIIGSGADAVISTVNGESNVRFFSAIEEAQRSGAQVPPVMSLSLTEQDLHAMRGSSPHPASGSYLSAGYFMSIDSPENATFRARFFAKHGAGYPVSDPMEAAYAGVILWARAAGSSGDMRLPDIVRQHLFDEDILMPEGIISVLHDGYAMRTAHIAEVDKSGLTRIVWTSGVPIIPSVYPLMRSESEWNALVSSISSGAAS